MSLFFYPRSILLACALSWAAASPNAQANIGQAFGFGSRTAALAGAGVAYGYEGFAAYHNPAGIPFDGDKRLILEVGIIAMQPSFTSINNVIVENTYVSDKVTYGDVDNDYRMTLGEELGLTYRLFPEKYNLSFGLALFLPMQQLAYMDTGETFVPEYVLYRSRTQRPQVEVGLGADLTPRLHVGLGIHLAFSLTSSATVFLQTDATKPSTMRFAASLKPKIAPQFGVIYTAETMTPSEAPKYTLGAVIRLPVSSPNSLYLKSGARAFGSFAALDFDFNAISTLFYDPLSLELGGTYQEGSRGRTYLQLDYQFWSSFQAPALMILDPSNESCGNGPCGVNISAGKNPSFNYKNTLVPRIAQEIIVGHMTLRAGYAYQPSIFTDLPTGAGNYLDPSKHILTAGLGLHFDHFLSLASPTDLDFHFSYQALVGQHVDKTPGDENGTGTGDRKIGAPGYDAGGKLYGGGVSLTLAF